MGKSQKLCQFLRKILHNDVQKSGSGSSRWPSFSSSSGSSSRTSSTLSRSRRCSMSVTDSANSSGGFDLDCDCEDECWSSLPEDVPAGCLPVYVGEERSRFIIPTSYLTNSTLQALLAKSEEEYGLRCEGGCASHALPMPLSICSGHCKAMHATLEFERYSFSRGLCLFFLMSSCQQILK